jgi:hypothetical protein
MQRVMLKDKRCATCRWWEGCREIFFVSQKPHAINYEGKSPLGQMGKASVN